MILYLTQKPKSSSDLLPHGSDLSVNSRLKYVVAAYLSLDSVGTWISGLL